MSTGPTNDERPKRARRLSRRRHVTVPLRLAARRDIDEWRRQQHDTPRRKHAIERLVILALENEDELNKKLR